jgi:general secretion pathway protein M
MNALHRLRQSMSLFLAQRNERERRLLAWAAIVVALGLVYALLIDPALSGRAQLRKSLPALQQQVAELQTLAREAAALSGKTAAPAAPVSRASLESTLGRNGLSAQNLVLSGDFIKLQLSAVPFSSVVGWLGELQTSARVRVTEASITALAEPGTVNATLTLQQQKNE